VGHVPQRPPQTDRPGARLARHARAQRQQVLARHPRQQATPPRPRERRQPARQPLPRALLILLAVMVLGAVITGILYNSRAQRLGVLESQRAQEEARRLAHRMEHLNARANSGFGPLIEQFAREYNINPSFLSAVIKCESSYRPDAVSRVNARGLMQIMPNTGTWLAGKLGITGYQPEALFDPQTNIRFGAYYLAYLSDMFGGDPVMVASAYHAGDNNVKRWALGRSEDMKTIRLDQIPMDDTRSYVRKVMDAYAIYYEHDQGGPGADPGGLPAAPAGRLPGH